LSQGTTYPLNPIPSDIRLEDIKFHKDHGNHKSASKFHEEITAIIQDDVEKGFALPLPIEKLPFIPNASVAPIGCHRQTTLNMLGEQVPKFRLTHDQFFPGPSGSSVNIRTDHSKLPPVMYRFFLKRIIHFILNL
jgi:hypothetical protein